MQVLTSLLDPYGSMVKQFVLRSFPDITVKSQRELLDALTEAIVGTGAVRLGPKPSPESLVKIREVITFYTNQQRPIPFMVPWGSEKPDGTSVDIAELGALKSLNCLYDRIRRLYGPAAVFNVRIEDASAPHLFYDRKEQARLQAKRYTDDFQKLIHVLEFGGFIVPKPESAAVTEEQFAETADTMVPVIRAHLVHRFIHPNEANAMKRYGEMTLKGWWGWITDETVQFFFQQYEKMIPNMAVEEKVHILARYFSAAWARKLLKIRGDDPDWDGGFIDLSFAMTPPGAEAVHPRRVTYRTFPCALTSNHMPAWRAKGYLLISGDHTRPRLASYHEKLPYNEHTITLTADDVSVQVQADYVIEECL